MIPIRLQMRNFICYRENVPPLSFEDFHVVCLSGDNGNGKSALLDAITWSIWGKARVEDRELIHFGRTEMEVEFEFALGDDRYRIIRKRSLKYGGKAVRSLGTLDLQIFDHSEAKGMVGSDSNSPDHDRSDGNGSPRPLDKPNNDGGRYRSIAGNNVDDTQRQIVDILRMDYSTFVNSAFLRQGRADEFTAKQPAQRKEVLADILGLGYYDDLAGRARDQARLCEQELRELAASVREIDKTLAQKPEFERQLTAIHSEMAGVESAIAALEAEVAAYKAHKSELDIKTHQLATVKAKIAQAEREVAEITAELERQRQRIREFEDVLACAQDIEDGFARFVAARAKNEALNEKMALLVGLKDRENALARVVAEARSALVTDQRVILSSVEMLQKRAAQAAALERQLGPQRQQAESWADLDARRDERREFAQSCRTQVDLLKSMNVQLKRDMESIKEKLELLQGAESSCPLCESDLGPSGRDRLAEKLGAEGRQMGDSYRENGKQADKLDKSAQAAQGETARIEQTIRERDVLQRQIAKLEKGLEDANEAERQLAAARVQLEAANGKIEQGEYALAEQRELAEVSAQMVQLGYDEERHRRAKNEMAACQHFEAKKAGLDIARERVGEERVNMERTEGILARWQESLEHDLAEKESLLIDIQALPDLEQKIVIAEKKLDTFLGQQAGVRMRLGQAQQMLNHCRYLEGERREKAAIQARMAEDESLYKDLAVAFGKNGVQAMIIDGAIPEIEDEANALLTRMTDGRLHVTLETQQEKQAGGLKETLEIRVGDELGLRSYDTYSGGEAFRINFAIRVALSKMLARRAGARLQTLVVDEGFGTLDVSGRDSLVEAINSISDDFAKIIVVTHIQELKDAFPARIDVVKDAEGSQVIVN